MLDDLMVEIKARLQSFSLYKRVRTVNEMFNPDATFNGPEFLWLTDVSLGQYDKPLKAILLGIPLVIYVHEREDGRTFDVVHGGEIVEGLRYYMRNVDHTTEHQPYHRKIRDFEITVVTFRCTMSHQDVMTCMEYLK